MYLSEISDNILEYEEIPALRKASKKSKREEAERLSKIPTVKKVIKNEKLKTIEKLRDYDYNYGRETVIRDNSGDWLKKINISDRDEALNGLCNKLKEFLDYSKKEFGRMVGERQKGANFQNFYYNNKILNADRYGRVTYKIKGCPKYLRDIAAKYGKDTGYSKFIRSIESYVEKVMDKKGHNITNLKIVINPFSENCIMFKFRLDGKKLYRG